MGFRVRRVVDDFVDWVQVDVYRLGWCLRHLIRNDDTLFYTGRTAREDIGHAFYNLFVEGIRMLAYPLGHLIATIVLLVPVFWFFNSLSNWMLTL